MAATTLQGLRALQRGELAGMLPDQVARSRASVIAPFFGVPATTMLLVVPSSERNRGNGCVCCRRVVPHGTRATTCALWRPRTGSRTQSRGVEQCVRICPAQYQRIYRRCARSSARRFWARGADRNQGGFLRATDPQAVRRPV